MKTYVFSILNVVADVIGVYVSSDMIAAANLLAIKQAVFPYFRVLDMVDLEKPIKGSFNLILCLGNSLALSPSTISPGSGS